MDSGDVLRPGKLDWRQLRKWLARTAPNDDSAQSRIHAKLLRHQFLGSTEVRPFPPLNRRRQFGRGVKRAVERLTGLEWERVDLARNTAWLNQTKNGTPRGVPLNVDAVPVLREQIGKHPCVCFTYEGQPLRADVANTAWHTALKRAGIKDFRFHDLRHT